MILSYPLDETPQEQRERVNAETRRFAVPPGFSARAAAPELLEAFGFPPRPDLEAQPDLFGFWERMFPDGLTYVRIEFELALAELEGGESAGAAFSRTHHESSLNWSGAYVTPRDGQMFTDVVGSWRVPTVMAPPGAPAGAMYGSSTWIGFDGQRGYLHSTLPQIGTGQFLNLPGRPGVTTISWFQWWPRYPYRLPMPIAPNDEMLAWLRVIGRHDVHFVLVNLDQMQMASFVWRSPVLVAPPYVVTPVQAIVSGATAEWVMERPSTIPAGNLFTLPSYTPVTFENCYAVASPAPLAPPYRLYDVSNPFLIRMYRRERNPRRTVTTSVARRQTDTSVQTTYRP